jgi:tetratricopeptide (TPR) repeat protein
MSDGPEPDSAGMKLLWARIKLARGDLGGALKALLAAEEMDPQSPGIYIQLGDAYGRLLQWQNAKLAYEKAVALDPDNALAFQGLSNVYRRLGDNQQTVDCALRAVSLLHRLPLAHFNLGVALARSGDSERAAVAFETALRFQPEMVNAHRYLATINKSNGGNPEKAEFHRTEVIRLARRRRGRSPSDDARREKLFGLPPIQKRKERLAILLKERPDPKPEGERSGKTFVLVSGLPRSGTSLMMQMLEAGGVKPLTDGERSPDVDNPKGYYEWEPIKQIGKKPELLDQDGLDGCAIKCISMLLSRMPPKHNYKVIFMTRPIEEVVRSQRAMIDRRAAKTAEIESAQLIRGLRAHRDEALSWLKFTPHMEFIEIDYPTLVREPLTQISRLIDFLGKDQLANCEQMARVVDASLYRKRV